MNFLIVGGGAAGIAAAEAIRSVIGTENNGDNRIEILSDEEVPGYNRPQLTKSINIDFDVKRIAIKDENWYSDNDIRLTLSDAAVSIDREKKTVMLSDGTERKYDKLILATGASSFLPPVPGADLDGVFTIRTFGNIIDIKNKAQNAESAVVIGGGVLGLEAADDLKKILKKVTILERSDGLMSKQLDKKASAMLKTAAEDKNIDVILNSNTREIASDGEGNVAGVFLDSGEEIPADLVIFSTGIVPNIETAKTAGLDTGRAIKVDECCRTNDTDIYAAGDCAEFNGIDYGILPQALEMGRVAGVNAAEDSCREIYAAVAPSNLYNGMGVMLFAIGDNGHDPDAEYRVVETQEGERLYYIDDRFVGAVITGNLSKVPAVMDGYKKGKYEHK